MEQTIPNTSGTSNTPGISNHSHIYNHLNNLETSELEKLVLHFGEKFDFIDIEKGLVFGYKNQKKRYLGTEKEYHRYRELKRLQSSKSNRRTSGNYHFETYNNFNMD